MNIVVGKGKVTDAAKAAIEAAGGRIEDTLQRDISLVVVDGTLVSVSGDNDHAYIVLPTNGTLCFTRAWRTQGCSLDRFE